MLTAIEESSSNREVVSQHNAFTIVTEICWFGPNKINSAKFTVQYSVPYSVNILCVFWCHTQTLFIAFADTGKDISGYD